MCICYFRVQRYLLLSLTLILLWLWSILVHIIHICPCLVRFPTQIDWYTIVVFHEHTMIEVKLTISDRFNSLQFHKICRRCLWTWTLCNYSPFCINSSQFLNICQNTDHRFTWNVKYIHCPGACCKYLTIRWRFRSSLRCPHDCGNFRSFEMCEIKFLWILN